VVLFHPDIFNPHEKESFDFIVSASGSGMDPKHERQHFVSQSDKEG
jgi:hypothetical protein